MTTRIKQKLLQLNNRVNYHKLKVRW